jgi:hypothetical protein
MFAEVFFTNFCLFLAEHILELRLAVFERVPMAVVDSLLVKVDTRKLEAVRFVKMKK